MFLKTIYRYIAFNMKEFLKFLIIDTIPDLKLKGVLIKKFLLKNLGDNAVIFPGVRWFRGDNLIIGDNVGMNIDCYLDDKATIKIGFGTGFGAFCKLITATHDKETMEETEKPIVIGRFCWIGANVTILPGVAIGDFCIIGAGSVVVKDIPEYSIAVGNPAKVIKRRVVKTPYIIPVSGKIINDFETLS